MRIAIDAGHGMSNRTAGVFDPGACAGDVREADVALAYALALDAALRRSQVPTWLTRASNTTAVPVGQRARLAQEAGCTAYVSLHLNAADSAQANGLEVLYRGEKDKPLADAMQRALVTATGFRDRGVQPRTDLAVLKFTGGPAVLIELGFITHADERAKMLEPAFRERVVGVIAATLRLVLATEMPRARTAQASAPPLVAPTTSSRLGGIARLVSAAVKQRPQLAGLDFLCRLPGAVYFESDLDLDTDGVRDPAIREWDPTHQDQTSLGGKVNANVTPYFVLPIGFAKEYGLRLGDVATLLYKDRIEHAIFADQGPSQKIGEGSIALHRGLGFERVKNGRVENVGIGKGVVTIAYQGSGTAALLDLVRKGSPLANEAIRAIGRELFARLGGKP